MSLGLTLVAQVLLILRKWGGLGLIVLGLVDNSIIPAPGSLDFFTIFLAARHRELWLYYALMALAGAVSGGYLTYRLGKKGGEESLTRRLSKRRVQRIRALFEKWGFAAIFVPAILPPPVPIVPFLLAAGTLDYPVKKFLTALAAGRAIRFVALAYLASLFGRRVFRTLTRHYSAVLWFLIIGAVAGGLTLLAYYYYNRKRVAPLG